MNVIGSDHVDVVLLHSFLTSEPVTSPDLFLYPSFYPQAPLSPGLINPECTVAVIITISQIPARSPQDQHPQSLPIMCFPSIVA